MDESKGRSVLPDKKPNVIIESPSSNGSVDDEDQITGVGKLGIAIDRDVYLQLYRDLQAEQSQVMLKNSILQRRLAEYYKKRKLDHALKEVDNSGTGELEEKYHQKLTAYEQLKEMEDNEMDEIKTKIENSERLHDDRQQVAERKFHDLQHLEKSTGMGLIYFNKGKPIPDKTVERLVYLQRRKSEQTAALRLRYIRVRNVVSELEITMRRLETIAPGLTVAHYHQLMVDNQNNNDKIEERDDELIKNRNKVTEHNQMLAHIREKLDHTDEAIDFTECDLGDVELEWLKAREELNQVKARRDSLRTQLNLERQKAGLLTRPDMLRDCEAATQEVKTLLKQRADLEESIKQSAAELRVARKKLREPHGRDSVETIFVKSNRVNAAKLLPNADLVNASNLSRNE